MTPLWTLLLAALPAEAPPAVAVDYVRDVKPILAQNCVKCHGPDKRRNGLRLDTAAGGARAASPGRPSFPATPPKAA